jgi:hypothetical protein
MAAATEHRPHDEHAHTHAEGCGHATVAHGDHVDFLHDGHAHHGHDDHYDECSVENVHIQAEAHEHTHAEAAGTPPSHTVTTSTTCTANTGTPLTRTITTSTDSARPASAAYPYGTDSVRRSSACHLAVSCSPVDHHSMPPRARTTPTSSATAVSLRAWMSYSCKPCVEL